MSDDRQGDANATMPMLRQILEQLREFRAGVEGRMSSIEEKVGGIESRMDRLEGPLDRFELRMDRLDERMGRFERSLKDVHRTLDRFQEYELRRLNDLDDRVSRLEEKPS